MKHSQTLPDFPTFSPIFLPLSVLSLSVLSNTLCLHQFWIELVLFFNVTYFVPDVLWDSVLGNFGSIHLLPCPQKRRCPKVGWHWLGLPSAFHLLLALPSRSWTALTFWTEHFENSEPSLSSP